MQSKEIKRTEVNFGHNKAKFKKIKNSVKTPTRTDTHKNSEAAASCTGPAQILSAAQGPAPAKKLSSTDN